jgi:hypothetical protein
MQMCQRWNLDFSGMVGVGDQGAYTAEGATACVCTTRSPSAGGPQAPSQKSEAPKPPAVPMAAPAAAAGAIKAVETQKAATPGHR